MTFLRILLFGSLSILCSCRKATPVDPPSPPAGPDTTSHSIFWQTDSVGEVMSGLLDVWGTSPTALFAVGLLQTVGSEPTRFVARYNGITWTTSRDDSLSWWIGAGALASVHGCSDTTIFVAGSGYIAGRTTSFVGRWNGQKWANISPRDSAALLTIWAKSETEVYAGGDNGTLLRYDGQEWVHLQTGTSLHVLQITGLPDGKVYAVASDRWNSYEGSNVFRVYPNGAEQEQFFPVGGLFGIWGLNYSCLFLAGEGAYRRSVNGVWNPILTPAPFVTLWSVGGTAPNNVLIAGAYGAVMHWNGTSWKFYDELYDHSSAKSYFKAFAIGNKYFLVGNTPSRALITIGTRSNP